MDAGVEDVAQRQGTQPALGLANGMSADLERVLWAAADKLRGHLDAAERRVHGESTGSWRTRARQAVAPTISSLVQ